MKILFWGTPALSVPFLELLVKDHTIVAVLTRPDRPAGRHLRPQESAVKLAAKRLGLRVFDPAQLKDPELLKALAATGPELGVLVSYGKILPESLFSLPQWGTLNVHFSLLPQYRGAAPIARALIQGEKETGITLFWMDRGMDTGPIFLQQALSIEPSDDALILERKLITLGQKLVAEGLVHLAKGHKLERSQEGPASIAAKLQKADGQIDWKKPAREISNLIRGVKPWPGASTFLPNGRTLRIEQAVAQDICPGTGAMCPREPLAGQIAGLERGKGFVVKCGRNSLMITSVQPEGKKRMSAWDFWQGAQLSVGDILGERT